MSERRFGVVLAARVDQYVSAMAQARAATAGFSQTTQANLAQVGGSMQRVGRTMTAAVTLPVVALGGAAVKMSMDFEQSFSRMVGLAGIPADEVGHLKQEVLGLAKETGVSAQQLADALYQASSSGLDTAQSMEAVGVAAHGAAAGLGSAEDIVGLAASAIASYGAESMDAAKATDILTQTIRVGRADPEELAGTFGRILPVASSLGVSFEEVGGATAYLSNIMGNTARTVTSMSGIMMKLLAPTEGGKEALKNMGTSLEELHAAIDENGLMGALDLLREHGFQGNREALRKLFDDVEAFQGATALLDDKSGNLAETMAQVADNTGALGEAFGAVADDQGFRMRQAFETLKVAMIQAGDIILPLVADIAEGIAGLVDWFADLPAPVQKVGLGLLGMAAAAGPVLIVMGSFIKNLQLIVPVMKTVGLALAGNPWVALAAAVAIAGVAIYTFMTRTSDFDKKLKELRETAKELAGQMATTGPIQTYTDRFTKAATESDIFRKALVSSGLVIDDLAQAAVRGGSNFTGLASRFLDGARAAGMTSEQVKEAKDVFFDLSLEVANTNAVFGEMEVAQGRAKSSSEGMAVALERERDATVDVNKERTGSWKALDDIRGAIGSAIPVVEELTDEQIEQQKAMEAARQAAYDYQMVLRGSDWGTASFTAAKDAFGGFSGELFSLGNFVQSKTTAFEAFYEAVDKGALNLDTATEAGRKQQDALEGIAEVMDTQLAAAWQGANGNMDVFRASARDISEGALVELAHGAGLSAEEVQTLREQLGYTEGDWEARIKLAGDAEAQLKLQLLQGTLNTLGEGTIAEVQTLILAGDWAGAVAAIQAGMDANPTTNTTNAVAGNWWDARAGLERGLWGWGNLKVGADAVQGNWWDARYGLERGLWGWGNLRVGADAVSGNWWTARDIMQRELSARPLLVRTDAIYGARATGGRVGPNESVTLVGEKGPEFVSLPPGSYVHTATQTASMMSGMSGQMTPMSGAAQSRPAPSGGSTSVQFVVEGNIYGDAALQRRLDEFGAQIAAVVSRGQRS